MATCLVLLGSGVGAAPAGAAGASMADYEARVLDAVNAQRVAYGYAEVQSWGCIDRYARSWADRLADTQVLVHRSMMSMLRGCSATRTAENLASGDISPERVVELWMASPGHRQNLLDGRLTRVGVAATRSQGIWTVVLDMAHP